MDVTTRREGEAPAEPGDAAKAHRLGGSLALPVSVDRMI